MANMDLKGQVALVTGSGRGLGRAIVQRLAELGADVAVHDVSQAAPAEFGEARDLNDVAGQLRQFGGKVAAITGDVTREADVAAMVESAERALGPISVLVNVAGGGQPKRFLELTAAEFDRVIQHNLKSAWSWAHHLAPQMLTRDGQRIVNTASISAKHGGGPPATVSKSAYAAAKAGVLGLTKGLAKELAPRVTVNAVCPGLIDTPGTVRITQGPGMGPILETIPMGRVGTPDDVAAAVLFFASPGAGWITGESMDINGGQYID